MLKFSELKENFEYPDAKVIDIKGEDIFVKQFLPAQDKYGIIYVCLYSLSLDRQALNPFNASVLFDIEVVKAYSSIQFDDEGESFYKVFDILENEGIIEQVIGAIPVKEYETLQEMYHDSLEEQKKYSQSTLSAVNTIIQSLPGIEEEIDKFDSESYTKAVEAIDKLSKDKHI